jgi:uncharacterized membrane protein HdeD (DUF308 family)
MSDTEETKPWYQSRGVIGGLVAAAAGIAAAFNFDISADTQTMIVEAVIGVGATIGGIVAVIGRIKASKKVG